MSDVQAELTKQMKALVDALEAAAALLQRGPCLLRDAVEDAQDVLGVLPLESP